jgi:hypothetical protein
MSDANGLMPTRGVTAGHKALLSVFFFFFFFFLFFFFVF